MSEVPEQAVNEMRVIAKQVASMYMSTEAERMDCANILYEALELVWRSQQAEVERLKEQVRSLTIALEACTCPNCVEGRTKQ